MSLLKRNRGFRRFAAAFAGSSIILMILILFEAPAPLFTIIGIVRTAAILVNGFSFGNMINIIVRDKMKSHAHPESAFCRGVNITDKEMFERHKEFCDNPTCPART